MPIQSAKSTTFPSPLVLFLKSWEAWASEMDKKLRSWRPSSPKKQVHQIRVLSRRLRSAHRILSRKVGGKKTKALQGELESITRQFGPLRSWQVSLQQIKGLQKTWTGPSSLKVLRKAFQKRVGQKKSKVWKQYQYPQPFMTLVNALGERLIEKSDETEFRAILIREDKVWEKRAGEKWQLFQESGKLKDLHRLRVVLKKWRYHQEILQTCLGLKNPEKMEIFKSKQKELGKLHDFAVLQEQIHKPKLQKQMDSGKGKKALKALGTYLEKRTATALKEIHAQDPQWIQDLSQEGAL